MFTWRVAVALGSVVAIAALGNVLLAPRAEVYIFKGIEGPTEKTVVPPPVDASWQEYGGGGTSRLAILLTDETSPWLGLAHGLKSIGIPFAITKDYAEAVRHRVVMVYPIVSGRLLSPAALQALAELPAHGGTLIGSYVLGGGLDDIFGIDQALSSKSHFEMRFDRQSAERFGLSDPRELVLTIGNQDKTEVFGTYGYTGVKGMALASYEDGQAAITENHIGSGRAYALGIDLGELLMQAYNNREEAFGRAYVNEFEPSIDVLLRILRDIYRSGEPQAVTLGTVPFDRPLSVIISHDIDYTRSLNNAIDYATYEKSQGVRATYFMQTKYVRDYNDEIMLKDDTAPLLRQLGALGMEIGSHTVAHSNALKRFDLGTGEESYPAYRPFVEDKETATGGTILGELRVSKFLIERVGEYAPVLSFRPGHLSNPYALSQSLAATGYRYSSSVTADGSLTHLPFQLDYNRDTAAETPIFEFPVTVEDEALPPLGERLPEALALADKIARYGGIFVLLIHPDILGHKLAFERGFVEALKGKAWFGALEDFGAWWAARDAVALDLSRSGGTEVATLDAPRKIAGLTLDVPPGWIYQSSEPPGLKVTQAGAAVVLAEVQGPIKLRFAAPLRPASDTAPLSH
jgi:peptidoglycan/xylan/chitin deacetylase (PgdA/CDA1 family)